MPEIVFWYILTSALGDHPAITRIIRVPTANNPDRRTLSTEQAHW